MPLGREESGWLMSVARRMDKRSARGGRSKCYVSYLLP